MPFERFVELKDLVEQRRRWRRLDEELSCFEEPWKQKSWSKRYRFVFIHKRVTRQHKAPIQLDLFVPHEQGYDFKVIVTNKSVGTKHVVAFMKGADRRKGSSRGAETALPHGLPARHH